MIRISEVVEGDKTVLTIEGHAKYAPKGQDIVCAGVSAVYQSALLGLKAIAQTYPENVRFD